MQVTHIVSLGGNCRLTYNLRRYFDFSQAYPFDWWVTGLTSVTHFLNDPDLDKLYDPAQLTLVYPDGKPRSVRSEHFKIELWHEFPHKDWQIIDDYRSFADQPKLRQAFLLKRFFSLNSASNNILLVRSHTARDLAMTKDDLAPYFSACAARFSGAAVTHLFINFPFWVDGVLNLAISEPDEPWTGNAEVWAKALSSLDIEFLNVEGTRFTGLGTDEDVALTIPSLNRS